ncbi:MAG: M23 family metallopeptidase [Magnetococcales bacterium]|nr:M23 family metallopeptidase [Magnetococcales bacterium]
MRNRHPNPTLLLFLAWLTLVFPGIGAAAGTPPITFGLPVACSLGKNCWIQNYPDRDPGPGAEDYRRGSLTYNDHRGTDFRVRTYREMRQGVMVIAAADGRIKAARDGMADGPPSGAMDRKKIGKRMAGNGVVIDHGSGWESIYGHLRLDSVLVKPGQQVKAGEPLGLIGQSGLAQFPHVHFEIRHNGKALDPFGIQDPDQSAAPEKPLWNTTTLNQLAYHATGELAAGFAGTIPDRAMVNDPPTPEPVVTSDKLIFWVNLFGTRAGDREEIRLLTPSGKVLAKNETTYSKHQAQAIRYIGKRRPDWLNTWPKGRYIGSYRLERNGQKQPVVEIIRHLEL